MDYREMCDIFGRVFYLSGAFCAAVAAVMLWCCDDPWNAAISCMMPLLLTGVFAVLWYGILLSEWIEEHRWSLFPRWMLRRVW